MQRVCPEGVLDIGGQQFGMLLLMIQAQNQTLLRLGRHPGLKEPLDRRFDMLAILKDRIESWTRERCTQLLFRMVRDGVVIAVQQPQEIGMIFAIAGKELRAG